MDFALVLAIVAVLIVLFFGVRRLPHLVGSLVAAGRELGHDLATHRAHGTSAIPPAPAEPAGTAATAASTEDTPPSPS